MKALAATALVLLSIAPASAIDVRPASESETSGLLQGCWREEGSDALPPQRTDMCFKADGVLTMSVVSCSEEHGCSESGIGGAYVVAGGKLKLNYNDVYRDVSCDVLIQPNQAFKISNCAEPQVGLAVPSRSFYRPTIGELK